MQLCNMAEIAKEVEFPACATLQQGSLHKVATPFFLLFMYMVQLYKEDWTILSVLGCRAVALPSTERIVKFIYLEQGVCYAMFIKFVGPEVYLYAEEFSTYLTDKLPRVLVVQMVGMSGNEYMASYFISLSLGKKSMKHLSSTKT